MKFNEDNQFWQYATLITDFVLLNLSFIVACLPVITIGPALSALFRVSMDLVQDESRYLVKPFWQELQRHFLRKVGLSAVYAVLIAACVYVIQFWYSIPGFFGVLLAVLFVLVLLVFVTATLIGLALSARYESSVRRLLRNSFLLIAVSPLWSFSLVGMLLVFAALALYQTYFLYVVGFVGFGLLSYGMAIVFRQLFKKVH